MQGTANPIWRADIAVRNALQASAAQDTPAAQATARVTNLWGGPGVIWFGAALWLGGRAFGRRAAARIGFRGLEALAVASAISGITKGVAGRARPFLGLEPWHWEFMHGWTDARFFSMPSGHTTATTAFAVGALFATRGLSAAVRVAIGVPLLCSALAVACARLYTNQHWLSDVVVAMCIGVTVGVVLAHLHTRRPESAYDRLVLGGAPAPVSDQGTES